jgi:hypothetical protein
VNDVARHHTVELRVLEPLTPTLPVRENLAAMPELLGGDLS